MSSYQPINIIKWFSVSDKNEIHAFVSANKNIIEMKYRVGGTGSSSPDRDWMVSFRGHLITHKNEYEKIILLRKNIEFIDVSKIKYVFELYFDKNATDSRDRMPYILNIIRANDPIYFVVYNNGVCKIVDHECVKTGTLRCITDEYKPSPTFSWNIEQVYYFK